MIYLLDANALIALAITDHEHHAQAAGWATDKQVALCPIVEGALVRFLVRVGEDQSTAASLLSELHNSPRCEFWTDSISYSDVALGHVIGHRQVTDAYLAALATDRGGRLATFDQGLATTLPESVELIAPMLPGDG